MKGVIIYKGKYGATQQYAEWLAAELRLPLLPLEKADASVLVKYDFVVIGSSVYIGKIMVHNWLKKHVEPLQKKKVFMFIVCATPAAEKEKLEAITQSNIPGELLNRCAVYFLRGRMLKEKLSWTDRFILKMGAMLQKDPIDKENMLKNFDELRKENLIPIEKDIQDYEKLQPASWLRMEKENNSDLTLKV